MAQLGRARLYGRDNFFLRRLPARNFSVHLAISWQTFSWP
jgi:hypothetical protein